MQYNEELLLGQPFAQNPSRIDKKKARPREESSLLWLRLLFDSQWT